MGRKVSKRKPIPPLGIDARKIGEDEAKTVRLNVRISPQEKAEIAAVARRLGLTVSDYVLGLHRQAVESLSKRRKGGRKNG